MRRKTDIELKAGIFLFLGIIIAMVAILSMGGGNFLFEKNFTVYTTVPDVGGLAKGAIIRSGGLKIGRVSEMTFADNFSDVRISLLVNQEYHKRIRTDSQVRIQTQGVLGDKYLEVVGGSPDKEIIADGASLEAEPQKDLSTVLADGQGVIQLLKDNLVNLKQITGSIAKSNRADTMMRDLTETAANMRDISKQLKTGNPVGELNQTLKNLKVVSEKMKNGEGTIGALFNDASLYEDLKNLIGGANRSTVLKFFVRQAVKSSDEAHANDKGKEPASESKK